MAEVEGGDGEIMKAGVPREALIMVSCLEEINAVIAHQVDDAMLLREAPGPYAGSEVFKRLGPSDAPKGVPHDSLYDIQRTQGDLAVRFHPVPQVISELRMKHGFAPAL